MDRIDTHDDLMTWSKNANHRNGKAPSAGDIADLQDVFSRSETRTIQDLFNEAPENDRHLMIFSIQKIMGSEALIQHVKRFARHLAMAEIEAESEEMNLRWAKVLKREIEIDKKIPELEAHAEHLESEFILTEARKQDLIQELDDSRRRVDDLTDENAELTARVEVLEVFEAHIKRLLND